MERKRQVGTWNENEPVSSTHRLETRGKDESEHEAKGTHQTGDCRHGKSDLVARNCRRDELGCRRKRLSETLWSAECGGRDELGHGKEATE
jgi:hypothetical protein